MLPHFRKFMPAPIVEGGNSKADPSLRLPHLRERKRGPKLLRSGGHGLRGEMTWANGSPPLGLRTNGSPHLTNRSPSLLNTRRCLALCSEF
jgi:hypothetical protein